MKARTLLTAALILAALALSGPAVWADTNTMTYQFSGSQSGASCEGYFYEVNTPNAHYLCFADPTPWIQGSTSSIRATLKDGITINIASSTNQIFVYNGLAVDGDVTVTVGGGTDNRYILHVALYNTADQAVINADVENAHSFSQIITTGVFYKLVIEYSDKDIYFINEASTEIRGVNGKYNYTGSPISPEPTEVVCNGTTLTKGTHYDISYTNNTDVGTATLTVTGKSPYHGSVSKDYEIIDLPLEWSAGSSVHVTADRATMQLIRVTGTGIMTLNIDEGVTLTANSGITIAGSATLLKIGAGSLIVTNSKGGKGADGTSGGSSGDGGPGGNGGAGSTAISGSLAVNGGTVNVTGGMGGEGGAGGGTDAYQHNCGTGGNGGAGGVGIDGLLTVNGGTVTIEGGAGGAGGRGGSSTSRGGAGTGGNGGNGGLSITGSLAVTGGTVNTIGGAGGAGGAAGTSGSLFDLSYGDKGHPGSYSQALGGTVICTATNYVIQEGYNGTSWSDLSGNTSTKQYVRVVEVQNYTLTAYQGTFAGQTRYWTTFYHPNYNYRLPAGAQAFIVWSDYSLCRIQDGSIIPADCAVVIISDTAQLSLTMTGSSATPYSKNILKGTTAATDASSLVTGTQKVYVLGKDADGTVGFYPFTGTTIPANKAYYVR